jgi:2'-5' RNA ligase
MTRRGERRTMQRLFFALWPDDGVRARIETATAGLAVRQGRRVPSENLHITLVFMGSVDASARIYAEAVADDLRAVSAELRLDQLGYWPGPRVLWLGASRVPPELRRLQLLLQQGIARTGMELDDRPFKPHMTLMRKVSPAPRLPTLEPIDWPIEQFALVESVTRSAGAVYRVLRLWELGG